MTEEASAPDMPRARGSLSQRMILIAAVWISVLLAALEGHPPYAFEVRAWDDPSWRAARELVPLAMAH